MSVQFSLGELPPDDLEGDTRAPDIEPPSQSEFRCLTCNKPLTYGGRGRKPMYCDEHKKSKPGGTVRAGGQKNSALASQAADVLMTSNAFIAFVAKMGGLENTHDQIILANPEFRTAAYEALLNDPELARSICRGGGMTGRMALIMAYAMFAMTVAPVAYFEIKTVRAARMELSE